MWEYSEKVLEHYRHPRNVGKIDNADLIGEAGSLACGDSLKLYIKLDGSVIKDAKFQTFGCGSAVASSSILTEMIIGKTLEEAKKAQADGADYLGVGAMYATNTKTDARAVTKEQLVEIRAAVDIPIVIIGGVNQKTVPNFKGMGIDGAAVVSAVVSQPDIEKAAKDLRELCEDCFGR